MKDQCRHVELLEIRGEIRLGERLDAKVGRREAGHHPLEPERLAHAVRDLGTRPVVAVERQAEILPELRTVSLDTSAQLVEYLEGQTAGVGSRLEHERWDGADQHGLGHTLGAIPTDNAGHLAPSPGMTATEPVPPLYSFD